MVLVVSRRHGAVLTHKGDVRIERGVDEVVGAFFVPTLKVDGDDESLDLVWGDVGHPLLRMKKLGKGVGLFFFDVKIAFADRFIKVEMPDAGFRLASDTWFGVLVFMMFDIMVHGVIVNQIGVFIIFPIQYFFKRRIVIDVSVIEADIEEAA